MRHQSFFQPGGMVYEETKRRRWYQRVYQYRIGRIPGVGPNLAVLRTDRRGTVLSIRNLGNGPRAMRIAKLIGRL